MERVSSEPPAGGRSWKRLVLRGAALLVSIPLTVLLVLFVLRARETRSFHRNYPPRGEMVDVGGFRMHLHCTGSGEPTVVLEAGYVDFSLVWSELQPQVAELTRVCSYDRAGLLWSERSPRPRSVDAVVEELASLLEASGESAPYVLVGHSLGGLATLHFAHRYADRVSGLVLVDASTHHGADQIPEDLVPIHDPDISLDQVKVARVLAWLGILRFVPGLGPPPESGLSPETIAIYEASWGLLPGQWRQAVEEWEGSMSFADDVRARELGLGDLPLIYLLSGRPGWKEGEPWSAEILERARALSRRFAEDTAALSSRGQVVLVPDASHDIHLDAHEEVLEAIRDVIRLASQPTPLHSR